MVDVSLIHTSCRRILWSGPSPDTAYLVSQSWGWGGNSLILRKMVETAQPSPQDFLQGSPLFIPMEVSPSLGREGLCPASSLPSLAALSLLSQGTGHSSAQ